MPLIAKYLGRVPSGRTYDDDELSQLQAVYEKGCAELGLDVGTLQRETFAVQVFQAAEVASNLDDVFSRAVAAYRRIRR